MSTQAIETMDRGILKRIVDKFKKSPDFAREMALESLLEEQQRHADWVQLLADYRAARKAEAEDATLKELLETAAVLNAQLDAEGLSQRMRSRYLAELWPINARIDKLQLRHREHCRNM